MSKKDPKDEKDEPDEIDVVGATLTAAPTASSTLPTQRPDGGTPDRPVLPFVDPSHYAVGDELARGGMGRILSARDRRLGRPVAIKELLAPGEALARRFEREAFITARLQHPGIVSVYEAGRWPGGEPFYAMKLVAGRSLKTVIGATRTLDERLALLPNLIAVVEALAYAHGQGIVHRDLKPANVLVGDFGETVVIDWGLAKEVGAPDEPAGSGAAKPGEGDSLTLAGAIMGTPAYMPLEQARGKPTDQRSDVYALGAILYHVLGGSPPYDADSSAQILHLLEQGPPRPLAAGVPRDLVTIVDKAMARDPAARYPSAKELAEELRRFQTGQLVAAHSYSRAELVRRWLRRNSAPVAVATIALVVLGATATVGVMRIRRERDQARDRADETLLAQARSSLDHDPLEALTSLQHLSRGTPRWPAARMIAADAVSRGLPRLFRGHTEGLIDLAFSHDGKLLATAGADKTVRLWDAASGKLLHTFEGHTERLTALAFSPDDRTLATGASDYLVILWDVATGASRKLAGHTNEIDRLAWTADGSTLLSLSRDEVRQWSAADGTGQSFKSKEFQVGIVPSEDAREVVTAGIDGTIRLWTFPSGESRVLTSQVGTFQPALAISPDGKQIAAATKDKTIKIWPADPKGPTTSLKGHLDDLTVLGFSPDGKSLASGDKAGVVRVWDVEKGESRQLLGHEGFISIVLFSPDGKHLATSGADRTVRLWDVASGEARILRGHQAAVTAVIFSPDGGAVASACDDGVGRLWDLASAGGHELGRDPGGVTALAVSPDGATVASAGGDHDLVLQPTTEGGQRRVLEGADATITRIVYAAGGELLTTGLDKSVRRWDLATGRSTRFRGRAYPRISVGKRGRFVAAPADEPAKVRLWEIATGRGAVLEAGDAWIAAVALDADERRLAAAGVDGKVHVWELGGGPPVTLDGGDSGLEVLLWTPDGRTLAAAGAGHELYLWDAAGRRRTVDLGFKEAVVGAMAADGRLLAVSGQGGAIAVVDLERATVRAFVGHTGAVNDLAFSVDGRTLASASNDGTLRLWDLASGEQRALRGHEGSVEVLAYAPDGRSLVSGGSEGHLRVWTDDLPNQGPAFLAWLDRTLATVSPASAPR